jgi:hypothetical protein
LALASLVLGLLQAADARLELPDPLIPGVELEATVEVSNAEQEVQNVALPSVPGVEWHVAGRSSNVSIINGAVTRTWSARVALTVSAAIPIVFPPITVTLADGSTISTAAVNSKPEAANAALTGEAYAQVEFDPATIVPGEPTSLIYRIYLRQDHDRAIKEPGISPPSTAISLGERAESSGTTTDANGIRWSVMTYRWSLTVSQPGPVEVSGQQEYFRCRRDFFNRLVPTSTHQIAVKPATLTVEALPTTGRPADFTGLFGPLEIAAHLDRQRIVAGEGTVFELTVHGRQVELLSRPTLALPAGLQAYPKDDPAAGDTAKTAKAGAERHFRWDLVPSQPGTYAIPAVSLPYYDPKVHQYLRANSAASSLTVLPGHTREIAVTGSTPARPSATPAEPAHAALPAPLRGLAPYHPPVSATWLCGAVGLLLGLAIAAWQRQAGRPARGPHRGHLVRDAVTARDPEAMSKAVQALLPALADTDARAAAQRLLQCAELARFGGQPLPDGIEADARLLEERP